jgi:hypothetical protein
MQIYMYNMGMRPYNLQRLCHTLRHAGGFRRVHRFPPPITDRHDITEILLNIITLTLTQKLTVSIPNSEFYIWKSSHCTS